MKIVQLFKPYKVVQLFLSRLLGTMPHLSIVPNWAILFLYGSILIVAFLRVGLQERQDTIPFGDAASLELIGCSLIDACEEHERQRHRLEGTTGGFDIS